jgi:homoserine dehydrogenase
VVTANKALLAVHGGEIFAAAEEKRWRSVLREAWAGIPIIRSLKEGLVANRIKSCLES